ncbi:MAG: S-methyl-5'-thioinosine phosphorylase [Spongiibacteraceae bacterium]
MLGIIGGTGLNAFHQGSVLALTDTPYGAVSTAMIRSEIGGRSIVFLARHGSPHSIAPDKINYRANIWALKHSGVTQVLAINAVGGINPAMPAGALVIPDQLIDYSYGRKQTFYDGDDGRLEHIDFGEPFSQDLRQKVIDAAGACSLDIIDGGVYGVTQGPRLETAAEINRMERDGCDVVGMTAMPEAALARELQLDYASICLVVNPAAGRGDSPITMADIHRVVDSGMIKVCHLLTQTISTL